MSAAKEDPLLEEGSRSCLYKKRIFLSSNIWGSPYGGLLMIGIQNYSGMANGRWTRIFDRSGLNEGIDSGARVLPGCCGSRTFAPLSGDLIICTKHLAAAILSYAIMDLVSVVLEHVSPEWLFPLIRGQRLRLKAICLTHQALSKRND